MFIMIWVQTEQLEGGKVELQEYSTLEHFLDYTDDALIVQARNGK